MSQIRTASVEELREWSADLERQIQELRAKRKHIQQEIDRRPHPKSMLQVVSAPPPPPARPRERKRWIGV